MKSGAWGSALVIVSLVASAGCETPGQFGALAGGGIGALAGQAIGRDTERTLIGAAVGTGIGYVIGNERDKQRVQEISQRSKEHGYTHTEVSPLGGTRWQLVELSSTVHVPPYASKFVEFRPYGRVITTTINLDGSVDIVDERYRVVDDTLIVNRPGYLVNTSFGIVGDRLLLTAGGFGAVLNRIR